MNLQHVIRGVERRAKFSWVSNDTGPGQIELDFDHPAAQWIHDHQGRIDRGEGRGVVITVDYMGARWGGLLDKYAVTQREDGDQVLVCDFLHDYEQLKWVTCWSNPFLPTAFQFPKAFTVAGPVSWILKLTLMVNLVREEILTIPDDPLDLSEWFSGLNMYNWPMVIKPQSFLAAAQSGVTWGVVFSRFSNWHDMAHTMLEDAELSVRMERWIEGDDPPWEGANLRSGTIVMDIVDKSDVFVGTSHGGTVFDGLVRTAAEWGEDFIDSTLELAADVETPTDYKLPGWRLTHPSDPYVVFREGETSPIQTSDWVNSPAKGKQVLCGGHSSPGVNEAISASVQALFDVLGGLAMIGSLGGTVDEMLKPLYTDTVLAWQAKASTERAQNSGWQKYFEYFQATGQQANKAYTLVSLMVLRAGFFATKTVISWRVTVSDAEPWMVGDRGQGHLFLDDRAGLVLKGDTKIHMDRARKIDIAWDAEKAPYPEFELSIGDDRIWQDPAERAWGKIESLMAGLRDIGVW